MSFESKLRQTLLEYPGIAAMVGTRVYPMRLAKGQDFPAIVYQRISGAADTTHDASRYEHPQIQIGCWGHSYYDARELAEMIKAVFKPVKIEELGKVIVVNEYDVIDQADNAYGVFVIVEIWP